LLQCLALNLILAFLFLENTSLLFLPGKGLVPESKENKITPQENISA